MKLQNHLEEQKDLSVLEDKLGLQLIQFKDGSLDSKNFHQFSSVSVSFEPQLWHVVEQDDSFAAWQRALIEPRWPAESDSGLDIVAWGMSCSKKVRTLVPPAGLVYFALRT